MLVKLLCLIFRYASGDWIRTLAVGAEGEWEIRVKGTLATRADTGLVNSSPISAIFPVVRVRQGCDHTIRIPGKCSIKCFSSTGLTSSNNLSVEKRPC